MPLWVLASFALLDYFQLSLIDLFILQFVDTKMSGAFYQLGIIVGTYPFRTKLFAVLLVLACASGFSKLETENRPEKLWIPVDTRAVKDQAKLIQNFPRNLRVNTAILTPKEGSNVLTKEVLLAAMDFHNEIVSFKVEALDQEWTWNNICQPAGFGCLISRSFSVCLVYLLLSLLFPFSLCVFFLTQLNTFTN